MASLVKRGNNYYFQWRVGKKIKRRSLWTDSLQVAKEKLRQFESAQVWGDELPFWFFEWRRRDLQTFLTLTTKSTVPSVRACWFS